MLTAELNFVGAVGFEPTQAYLYAEVLQTSELNQCSAHPKYTESEYSDLNRNRELPGLPCYQITPYSDSVYFTARRMGFEPMLFDRRSNVLNH